MVWVIWKKHGQLLGEEGRAAAAAAAAAAA